MSIAREIDAWYEELGEFIDGKPIPYLIFSPVTHYLAAEITTHGDGACSWLLSNGDIIYEPHTGTTTRLISHCACGDEIPDGATFCVMCGRLVRE